MKTCLALALLVLTLVGLAIWPGLSPTVVADKVSDRDRARSMVMTPGYRSGTPGSSNLTTATRRLTPPASGLVGKVVDETGSPLSGVLVLHTQTTNKSAEFCFDQSSQLDSPHMDRYVRTNEQGKFEFANPPTGAGAILVESSSHRDLQVNILVRRGQPCDTGTLALQRGHKISGYVVDRSGRPISGAQVFPCSEPRSRASNADHQDRPRSAQTGASCSAPLSLARTTSTSRSATPSDEPVPSLDESPGRLAT